MAVNQLNNMWSENKMSGPGHINAKEINSPDLKNSSEIFPTKALPKIGKFKKQKMESEIIKKSDIYR